MNSLVRIFKTYIRVYMIKKALMKPIIFLIRQWYLFPFNRNRLFKKELKFIPSRIKIDILTPVVEKDLEVLPYVISGIRKNLKHPIGNINIIAPQSLSIINFCKQYSCRFFDEDSVLPIKIKDINYVVDGVNRSGWLFQTLLKWADNVCSSEYYFVTCADTVLIRPQVFLRKDRMVLLNSDSYHPPYYQVYEKLIGEPKKQFATFTANQIFISKTKLAELKKVIKDNTGLEWYRAIVEKADRTQGSGYSGYETYGSWLAKNYPDEVVVEYWFNKSLRRDKLRNINSLMKGYSDKFKSLSFHSFIK